MPTDPDDPRLIARPKCYATQCGRMLNGQCARVPCPLAPVSPEPGLPHANPTTDAERGENLLALAVLDGLRAGTGRVVAVDGDGSAVVEVGGVVPPGIPVRPARPE